MEDKNIDNFLDHTDPLIKNILKKYSKDKNIKIIGKVLQYIKHTDILIFYVTIYKSTQINPFSSDIMMSLEFKENIVPYVQILNDFINPTLNDGRNIYFCLTNKHTYCFNKNNEEEFQKMFKEIIEGIKLFLLCIKENIQINALIIYGEYEIGKSYQINDLLLNKSTLQFIRVIEIVNKTEKLKYIIISQLFFLAFEPDGVDKSIAKLVNIFLLKDINFAFNILNTKKGKRTVYTMKLIDEHFNDKFMMDFYFPDYVAEQNQVNKDSKKVEEGKYLDLKQIVVKKKNEIDFSKYKIVILNSKPLFSINIKKNNKKVMYKQNLYNDYKLYITYFEELYNYYKDFDDPNIKARVDLYKKSLTYYCVDFISFYDFNPEEVKLYQEKINKYT